MIGKGEKSGANLRLLTRSKRNKKRRELKSGALLDQPKTNMALNLLSHEHDQEEKKPAQYSLLITLAIVFVALYVVFPTFVKNFELEKKEDIIHVPAGGYPVKAQRKQSKQVKRIRKKEVIPQLFPEVQDVEMLVEDDVQEDTSDDWASLDIDGQVDGFDFGNGGSGGGPILNAGEGGDVPKPELIYRVEPEYPDAARTARIDGFVLLQATINEKGDVVNIKVLSTPQARYGFSEKAIQAVSQWKFKPSIYKGKPVSVRIKFSVEFNLVY